MINIRKTLIEKISSELERLDDAALLEEYAAVFRRPSQPPPPLPAGEPRDLNTKPGSTISIVWRVLERANRPIMLRDIVTGAQRENRALTRAMISGAVSRLVKLGRVERRGAHRSGTYRIGQA